MWKLNNTLLNNQWLKEENLGEMRKYLRQNKMKIQCIKTVGCDKNSSKSKVYSDKCLIKKEEIFQVNILTLQLMRLEQKSMK